MNIKKINLFLENLLHEEITATDEEITQIINKVAPRNKGWEWDNDRELTVFFANPKAEDAAWSKLENALYPLGIADVMVARK